LKFNEHILKGVYLTTSLANLKSYFFLAKTLRRLRAPSQLFEVAFAVPTFIDNKLKALLLLDDDQDFVAEGFLHYIQCTYNAESRKKSKTGMEFPKSFYMGPSTIAPCKQYEHLSLSQFIF